MTDYDLNNVTRMMIWGNHCTDNDNDYAVKKEKGANLIVTTTTKMNLIRTMVTAAMMKQGTMVTKMTMIRRRARMGLAVLLRRGWYRMGEEKQKYR